MARVPMNEDDQGRIRFEIIRTNGLTWATQVQFSGIILSLSARPTIDDDDDVSGQQKRLPLLQFTVNRGSDQ